jgi:hypothetical protein
MSERIASTIQSWTGDITGESPRPPGAQEPMLVLVAYCMEVATTDDVPASAPSRLDEAIDALIDLDEATIAAAVCGPAQMSVNKTDRRGQAA